MRRKIIIMNANVKFAICEADEILAEQELCGVVLGKLEDITETTLTPHMEIMFDPKFKCSISRMEQLMSKIRESSVSLYKDVSDHPYFWYQQLAIIDELKARTFITPVLILLTN